MLVRVHRVSKLDFPTVGRSSLTSRENEASHHGGPTV